MMSGKKEKLWQEVSMGMVKTTYLIDEQGIIIKANDKVKAEMILKICSRN